ncbi:MAG: hypothetical protein AAF702_32050 [Chloroflexota bacterium]
MPKKNYVLWVEDDATYNLQYIAAPVVMNPRIDLTLAITATEAIHFLKRRPYDALIFDLRLPPGKQEEWVSLDQKLGQLMEPPRLGLHLLRNLYCPSNNGHTILLPAIPPPPPIHQVGILSVDPWDDVADGLATLEFQKNNYRQKQAGMPSNILLQLVQDILGSYR